MPDMRIEKTGYGAGKRETGSSLPNLLRLVLGKKATGSRNAAILKETIHVIKTNIDDMNPEISGDFKETLLENFRSKK